MLAWRSLERLVEFAWFAGSTAAFQATRLATGLLAASTVSPDDFAIWGLMLVVLNYSNYLNLGVLSAANREIPIRLGRGMEGEADRIDEVAHGVMLSLSLLIAALGLIAFLSSHVNVLLIGSVALAGQQLYLVQQVSYKARLRFNRASTIQAVLAISFPVIALPLIGQLGVPALIGAQAAAYFAAVVIGWLVWPPLRPRFAPEESLALAITGFPIMLAGFLFALLSTVDRWFVLFFLGRPSLGNYTLAGLLSSVLLFVAILVAQQSYPRLALALGRGAKRAELLRAARRQATVAIALACPISVAVAVGAPLIVPNFFPGYVESIPAIQVLAVGMLALVASTAYTNLLVALGRSWHYLLIVVSCLAIQTIIAALVAALAPTLVAFAFGASVSYVALLAFAHLACKHV